jgi:hypothetical protein
LAWSAKNEVSRCTTSRHLTLFYALTTIIRVPFEASFQAGWVVLGLYIGNVFTFSLIYHFSIIWFYSFLDDFAFFWIYSPHPGKAGNLKCPKSAR